jgi:hypothetical protein
MGTPEGVRAPSRGGGPAPVRQRGTLRRTTTLDTCWPEGPTASARMTGRGQDSLLLLDGSQHLLAQQSVTIDVGTHRNIIAINAAPACSGLDGLVGARAGGQSRTLLGEVLPGERAEASLLHGLIDDFAGASLVAPWALSRWPSQARANAEAPKATDQKGPARRSMSGVCIGLRPGASSLDSNGMPRQDKQSYCRVVSLIHPEDPQGWHSLADQAGPGMRRARWTDIRLEGDFVLIGAGFQDSAVSADGGREAIHEYRIAATAHATTGKLLAIEITPHILPYNECPKAIPNTVRLLGGSLAEFRQKVPETLPGTAGCTHLNDVLRTLADVPALTGKLKGAQSTAP